MSNDVQIIEAGSDITPAAEPQVEVKAEERTEEEILKELQDRAFEAEQAIAAYRTARLAFVRKHTKYPKTELLDKQPSELHESLAMYIAEKTGHHLDGDVIKVVQLTLALHGEHQKSDEWKIRRAEAAQIRQAAKAVQVKKSSAFKEKQVAAKVDKVEEAFQVGLTMLEAGVQLPESVMVGLRAHAEAKGITLPGEEPKTDENPEVAPETSSEEQVLNSETEAKPATTTRPRRAAKVKPVKADA